MEEDEDAITGDDILRITLCADRLWESLWPFLFAMAIFYLADM